MTKRSFTAYQERFMAAMSAAGCDGNRAAFVRLAGYKDNAAQVGRNWFDRDHRVPDAARKPLASIGLSIDWINDDEGQMRIPATSVSRAATRADYVRAEQLDAEGGMGNERINADVPDVIRSVEYAATYIRALVGFVPSPGRLMLVTGRGDSMRPTIEPGETVLVDTGCDAFDGDGLYLVNSGNGQQIKRLQDRAGVVFVVSDNAFYAAVPATEKTRVSGRVHLIQHLERVS